MNAESKTSSIFSPYRTLGLVSNHIPLCTHYNGKQRETYAITCVGRAFHSYKSSNFGLTWISDCHNAPITCMASDDFFLFTGCEKTVTAFFHGGTIAHRYVGHEHVVTHLLPMGEHLLSADAAGLVYIWNVSSGDLHGQLTLSPDVFDLTAHCHPLTYVNKVLFGSRQGHLALWNVRSLKQLYRFEGWKSAVTVLEQSPAVDIVAVGLASGAIILHNIRSDETLLQFSHDDGGIASITFRTDEGFSSIMLSGSQLGHIAVWNLEKRQLVANMRNAHLSVVSGLRCINGEPLVLSSSPDNSLKLWVFDLPDSSGRLLRERSGHSAPLTCVKFHDGECARNDPDNTIMMLTAGLDGTLRVFSPFSDADNRSLGRASFNRKQLRKARGEKKQRYLMPPIVELSSESARQSDWDCVVCCHEELPFATTWNLNKWTMGSHRLGYEDSRKAANNGINSGNERVSVRSSTMKVAATVCTLTPCGNFALVGYNTGHVDVFNIQSGIYRGSFSCNPKSQPLPPAHDGPVRGVCVDAVNNIAVTADGTTLGRLCFWQFRNRRLISTCDLGAPVSRILLCRENSLLGVALDDFRLVVVDIDLHRVVRILSPNHTGAITGLAFSPDGRWLISSSMDCTIRTWDLPTSCLVDCFVTSSHFPPLGIAMSPVGDFLASIHRDQLGVSLWTNRSLFNFVPLHPLGTSDVEAIIANSNADLPATSADEDYVEPNDSGAADIEKEIEDSMLLKLSLEPESKWFSLFNLDIIRERNKPRQPPQKPVNAPFFLPTVPGLEPKLALPSNDGTEKPLKNLSSLINLPLSAWTSQLAGARECATSAELCGIFDKLRQLGPSGIDLELRLITTDDDPTDTLSKVFFRCVKSKFQSCRDFDLAVAYLARYLKLNGHNLSKKPQLMEILGKEILPIVTSNWERLQSVCNRSLAVISFAKAPLVL